MGYDIPTREPNTVTAGDLWTWTRSLPDFKAGDGWALSYALTSSAALITLTGSASGDDHLISVAAATTAAYAAGTYSVQGYVTKATERYTVYRGDIEIRPNLAAASSGYDNRSHARKVLDSIEAAILTVSGGTVSSWSGLDESWTRKSLPELIEAREKYRAELRAEENRERIARGLAPKGRIQVRFVTPT